MLRFVQVMLAVALLAALTATLLEIAVALATQLLRPPQASTALIVITVIGILALAHAAASILGIFIHHKKR